MPLLTDGRDIDTGLGSLTGEGAQQVATQRNAEQVEQMALQPTSEGLTYYGRPLLKQSVWTIDIPLYYYLGGAAGAALSLGAAVQLCGNGAPELRRFAQQCHWIGVAGSTAGAALLIHDLGRPERFLYMMRVFRPTSPMNVGAWILAAAAPTAIATALFINRGGFLGWIGEIAGFTSGFFGAALATYTGVLVANSAVPVWQESRQWMPPLFAAAAMTSAAAILDMFAQTPHAARIVRVFGSAGRVCELAAGHLVERSASRVPRVGEVLQVGAASGLWNAAKVLTATSLVITLAPGTSRGKRRAAGILATAGAICLRFAVHYITNASARDARASFELQRT